MATEEQYIIEKTQPEGKKSKWIFNDENHLIEDIEFAKKFTSKEVHEFFKDKSPDDYTAFNYEYVERHSHLSVWNFNLNGRVKGGKFCIISK